MIEKRFDGNGDDFSANAEATNWCTEQGISVGESCRGQPRGLMWGDFDIAKWRNLSRGERNMMDGQMTGDMRHGPVFVKIKEKSEKS